MLVGLRVWVVFLLILHGVVRVDISCRFWLWKVFNFGGFRWVSSWWWGGILASFSFWSTRVAVGGLLGCAWGGNGWGCC